MDNPETKVTKKIKLALEKRGAIVVKLHGNQYTRAGFPDLLVIAPGGRVAFVEVKVPGRTDGPAGNGLSALQVRWLSRLSGMGHRAGHAATPDEALAVVFGE